MSKKLVSLCLLIQFLFVSLSLADNIVLNKDVFLNGEFFVGGWGGSVVSDASTLVDGVFLFQGNQWDINTVWWDENGQAPGDNNNIVIDLAGTYYIDAFTVQADDNDAYILEYLDENDEWKLAWDVPNYNWYEGIDLWGMQTRPDPYDNTMAYDLTTPLTAKALRLSGNLNSGDRYFSVSEVQAFGHAVPEPSTLSLLSTFLMMFGGVKLLNKRRKR